jgi:hypothetical protein
VNVSINIIVAIAGICLIDLCYIFVIHTQQDAIHRNKITGAISKYMDAWMNYRGLNSQFQYSRNHSQLKFRLQGHRTAVQYITIITLLQQLQEKSKATVSQETLENV